MRNLTFLILLFCCGCWAVVPMNRPELNQRKDESDSSIHIQNDFPSGTTALEAAKANSILLADLTKQRQTEKQLKRNIENEKAWTSKWKDHAMYIGIALLLVCIFFPAFAWKHARNLKKKWEAILSKTRHSVDHGMRIARLSPEQEIEMKKGMVEIQGDEIVHELRKHR